MSPTISGVSSLGNVISEINNINNNLITRPIPSTSTDLTVQTNLMGKLRTITIDGEFIGTETQIKVFVDEISEWVNEQGFVKFQSNRTYTDSFGSSYTVLADSFEYRRENISNAYITYTLIMKEGSTITNLVIGSMGE